MRNQRNAGLAGIFIVSAVLALVLTCSNPTGGSGPGRQVKTVAGVTVVTPPTKVQYNTGDGVFYKHGMVVKAEYFDEPSRDVTDDCTVHGFDTSVARRVTVTVKYEDETDTFSINVVDPNKGTVGTPVATPAAGAVASGVQVTLSVPVPHDDAAIWYTLDGSEPEENGTGSIRYVGPLTINESVHVVKAFAVKTGLNPSNTLVANYTIQNFVTVPADFENDLWLQYTFREMQIGETAEIYPRRVPEGVVDMVGNDLRWPKFNYAIIEGGSVNFTEAGSNPTVANISAVSNGVTIIKVTYNSFTHSNGNRVFGAISPVNTGYVVFSVTGAGSSPVVKLNPENLKNNAYTAELRHPYDRVYFTGDSVIWPIKPTVDGTAVNTVARMVPSGGGISWETVNRENDGAYNLKLENRENVIRLTTGGNRELFETIGARKVEINITPERPRVGQSVKISFKGINMPIHKLSGIYNPTAVQVVYNNGTYTGTSSQWGLATQNSITRYFNQAGTYDLVDGVTGASWFGHELGYDKTHKSTGPFSGIAPTHQATFIKMPDFTVRVRGD